MFWFKVLGAVNLHTMQNGDSNIARLGIPMSLRNLPKLGTLGLKSLNEY